MPPSRPVDATTIATEWGQAVHDYTFAPAGVRCHGGAALAMLSGNPSALRKMNLDTADDDPGGYLDAANDQAEVPTGGGGLYQLIVEMESDNGDDTDETDVRIRKNGADVAKAQVSCENATAVIFSIPWAGSVAAGDIFTVMARQIGANDRADVRVRSFMLWRIGDELGAPTP